MTSSVNALLILVRPEHRKYVPPCQSAVKHRNHIPVWNGDYLMSVSGAIGETVKNTNTALCQNFLGYDHTDGRRTHRRVAERFARSEHERLPEYRSGLLAPAVRISLVHARPSHDSASTPPQHTPDAELMSSLL